jgi:hypothetical protein
MMTELTEAILTRLKDRGLLTNEISFKDLIDGTININRPAVNITLNTASVKKVTVNTYKFVTMVSLILVVNWLKGGAQGEGQRKAKIYDLIESISNYLTIQDFGLALENPLFPTGFQNITTAKLAKAGYQLYELKFWCSWNVTKEEMYPGSVDLKSLVAQYTLEPVDAAAEPPQAEDILIVNP